jgi:hypothetical protein
VVALAIAGVAYLWWKRSEEVEAREAQEKAVTMSAEYDPTSCPNTEHPVRVEVKNASTETVKEIRLRMHAYVPGDSEDHGYLSTPEWTRVVRPSETKSQCWSLPELPRGATRVVFKPEIERVEFYEPGEFIP